MITVGIDLAAEPKNTAIATVQWSAAGARVVSMAIPADDDAILTAIRAADKVGLDCPIGWPEAFVEFVVGHARGHVATPDDLTGKAWRHSLANRITDIAVHDRCGLTPLSVSTDRIAHPAMRAADLLARLAAEGRPVDRVGRGTVVEVYPAASLKQWGLQSRSYKGPHRQDALRRLVDDLMTRANWLDPGDQRDLMASSDHAFDAVVAALSAWAAAHDLTYPPNETQAAIATSEGWVAVPSGSLADLWPLA